VDPPGTIRFMAHMATLGESGGVFRRWRIVRAIVDDERPERSEVELEVDLESIDTDNTERDRHLRSAKFFDVERYPTARVVVGGVRLEDAEHFTAEVRLDLHGRSASFPMRFTIVDRPARRIQSRTTVRRLDFDVGPPTGWLNPMNIRNEIEVEVDAIVPPRAPSP
jgi:polyisoprenoid-binding protein YceI